PRLGDRDEFKYIRTLLPLGDNEEDGLVYLSEPFLRRQLGPQVKIAEARRLVCLSHLRMIAHAAQLYRTQFGKGPASLNDLAQAVVLPLDDHPLYGALSQAVGGPTEGLDALPVPERNAVSFNLRLNKEAWIKQNLSELPAANAPATKPADRVPWHALLAARD